MFFCLQQLPSVLKCWHLSTSSPRGLLDPWITHYINELGFDELFHVLDLAVDHGLITALVECWHSNMHTFHLPHEEMSITLQDIEVMMGVPVDGSLVFR